MRVSEVKKVRKRGEERNCEHPTPECVIWLEEGAKMASSSCQK